MVNNLNKLVLWLIILAISTIVTFGSGIALKEVLADTATSKLSVNNNTPSVGTVTLNGGNDINLIESVTTTVQATTTVTDVDGYSDIASVTGKIFRSGAGSSCSSNDNNCYSNSACATSSCSGNSCTVTCSYDVWFIADPTDAGTYSSQYWEAYIKAIDASNASSSATSSGVEMNTLRALNLYASAINYGSLAKGSSTITLNQAQTTIDTGNEAIDVNLSGTRMEKSPWTEEAWSVGTSSASFEFNPVNSAEPAISQIDSSHYLVAYSGTGSLLTGWSQVLQINKSNWVISTSSAIFKFAGTDSGSWTISKIDLGHYLVVFYDNDQNEGWSQVLNVNTSTWAISTSSASFKFSQEDEFTYPSLSQIDSSHYLVAYGGFAGHGWSTVLNVNPSTWAISTSSASFEFNQSYGYYPDISQIDSTHYLVAYLGNGNYGWSTVLYVNPSTWAISTSSASFKFDPSMGYYPDISQIDSSHYLVAYQGASYSGWSTVLNVNTSTWAMSTSSSAFNLEPSGGDFSDPKISQIDSSHYLLAYSLGNGYFGWSTVLNVNPLTWAISTSSASFGFEQSQSCYYPDISQIDSTYYLVVYAGDSNYGWSTILNPTTLNVIPVEYQEYATSGVNYASGTDLTTTATSLELDLSKPTSHPSTSTDETYWGLMIPSYVQKGSYYGTDTFEAIAD